MSVATLVEAVTKRIKGRQLEQKASAFSSYRQLLVDAAAGKDVDIDELEILLESNDRRPEDFAADVDKYKERVAQAATLARIPVLQSQQRTTEAERDRLIAELQAVMDKINPQIAKCVEQLRGIETQLSACSGSEGRLLASVMDPGIIARDREINERRKEVGARLRAATERRDEAQKHRRYHEATGNQQQELQVAAELKARQSEVDAIEAEMREVDRDAAKLHAEMLVP